MMSRAQGSWFLGVVLLVGAGLGVGHCAAERGGAVDLQRAARGPGGGDRSPSGAGLVEFAPTEEQRASLTGDGAVPSPLHPDDFFLAAVRRGGELRLSRYDSVEAVPQELRGARALVGRPNRLPGWVASGWTPDSLRASLADLTKPSEVRLLAESGICASVELVAWRPDGDSRSRSRPRDAKPTEGEALFDALASMAAGASDGASVSTPAWWSQGGPDYEESFLSWAVSSAVVSENGGSKAWPSLPGGGYRLDYGHPDAVGLAVQPDPLEDTVEVDRNGELLITGPEVSPVGALSSVITLRPGETLEVRTRALGGVTLSGRLALDWTPEAKVILKRIWQKGRVQRVEQFADVLPAPDGQFEFEAVPDGEYVLTSMQPSDSGVELVFFRRVVDLRVESGDLGLLVPFPTEITVTPSAWCEGEALDPDSIGALSVALAPPSEGGSAVFAAPLGQTVTVRGLEEGAYTPNTAFDPAPDFPRELRFSRVDTGDGKLVVSEGPPTVFNPRVMLDRAQGWIGCQVPGAFAARAIWREGARGRQVELQRTATDFSAAVSIDPAVNAVLILAEMLSGEMQCAEAVAPSGDGRYFAPQGSLETMRRIRLDVNAAEGALVSYRLSEPTSDTPSPTIAVEAVEEGAIEVLLFPERCDVWLSTGQRLRGL